MCGGDEAAFATAEPVMACFGRAVTLMGPSGSGQLTKMVNQICIAGLVQGLSEAVAFGRKSRSGYGQSPASDWQRRGAKLAAR